MMEVESANVNYETGTLGHVHEPHQVPSSATNADILNNGSTTTLTGKRPRKKSISEESSPTKKARSNESTSLVSVQQSLSERKRELESKLLALNQDLEKITEKLDVQKPATPPKKATPKKASTKKKATTKKTPTETIATSRPKRQRKKSTILKEAEGTTEETGSVELSPGLNSCRNVLRSLMSHRYAHPFNTPVDPIALGIPDYPLIIKHPMDFGTIKQKLEEGFYEDVADFTVDTNLVFSNACTYNHPGSDVFVMAETLREFFRKKIRPIEEREQQREEKSQMAEQGVILELRKSLNSIREELHQLAEQKNAPPANNRSRARNGGHLVRKPPEAIPMSKVEMKQLSLAINSLSYEHLSTILKIIRQSMPNTTSETDVVFDITQCDNSTLRKLEAYVSTVKKKKQPRRKPSSISPTQQVELAQRARDGTAEQIQAVQAQLNELTSQSKRIVSESTQVSEEKTDINVEDGDSSSGSESDSDSSSDSNSESDSDSESESDSDSD